MVGFRFHLVSLVAVFLALALGLVIGTTELTGARVGDLRDQVTGLRADARAQQAETRALRRRLADGDAVTAALAPRIVGGLLKSVPVVLVGTPDADGGVVDGVQKTLQQAGARVTGRVQLTGDYTDPQRATDLTSFVTSGGQPAGFQLPETDDAAVLGAALLSYVLVRRSADGVEPALVSQVLAGFASLQMLRVEGEQVTPADYAVVVTSATAPGGADRARPLAQLAAALDRTGKGAVVAGTAAAAGAGGLVGVVRSDAGLGGAVSTVDDADSAAGRVATIFALTEQAAGKAGQYGLAGNADAPFPPMT
jgi:hypothetical protein